MPIKLEELPADVEVAWYGRKWDKGCTEDIHIYAPEMEYCHGCYGALGTRSTGVAERQPDDTWHYYDASCWGDVLAARYARETLEADDGYESTRPHPKDW